jgi:hypothetical protein
MEDAADSSDSDATAGSDSSAAAAPASQTGGLRGRKRRHMRRYLRQVCAPVNPSLDLSATVCRLPGAAAASGAPAAPVVVRLLLYLPPPTRLPCRLAVDSRSFTADQLIAALLQRLAAEVGGPDAAASGSDPAPPSAAAAAWADPVLAEEDRRMRVLREAWVAGGAGDEQDADSQSAWRQDQLVPLLRLLQTQRQGSGGGCTDLAGTLGLRFHERGGEPDTDLSALEGTEQVLQLAEDLGVAAEFCLCARQTAAARETLSSLLGPDGMPRTAAAAAADGGDASKGAPSAVPMSTSVSGRRMLIGAPTAATTTAAATATGAGTAQLSSAQGPVPAGTGAAGSGSASGRGVIPAGPEAPALLLAATGGSASAASRSAASAASAEESGDAGFIRVLIMPDPLEQQRTQDADGGRVTVQQGSPVTALVPFSASSLGYAMGGMSIPSLQSLQGGRTGAATDILARDVIDWVGRQYRLPVFREHYVLKASATDARRLHLTAARELPPDTPLAKYGLWTVEMVRKVFADSGSLIPANLGFGLRLGRAGQQQPQTAGGAPRKDRVNFLAGGNAGFGPNHGLSLPGSQATSQQTARVGGSYLEPSPRDDQSASGGGRGQLSGSGKALTAQQSSKPLIHNAISAGQYEEWHVIKVNRWGKRQDRLLGMDLARIYNRKIEKKRLLSDKTSRAERLIADISRVDVFLGTGMECNFSIAFLENGTESTVQYETRTASDREEIIKKLAYLLKMNGEEHKVVRRKQVE